MTKKGDFILIIIFLLIHSVLEVYSQDTIRNVSENNFEFIDSKYKNRKSVLRAGLYINAEDVTLWQRDYLDGIAGFGFLTSYELKLAKSHSINSGVKAYITNKKYENLKLYTSYRFYHNLKNRIELGKTGNNFAANYFFIETAYSITRSPYRLSDYTWDNSRGEWALKYRKNIDKDFDIWLGYGLQRNVFKNFNVDANLGLNTHRGYIIKYLGLYLQAQVSLAYIIK